MSGRMVANQWNGEWEDGDLPRPGYRMPASYVIQTVCPGVYVWAVTTQPGRVRIPRPLASGTAATLELAQCAVETAL